jgi:hypothetical protein
MVLMKGLKTILGWKRLTLSCRYGYVEMRKCLTTTILLFYRLSTDVFVSTEGGESGPVYEVMFMVEGYNEGYFFPIWVSALDLLRLRRFYSFSL